MVIERKDMLKYKILGVDDMNFISASYNMYHNSIDITTFDGYILRIDCNEAEEGLKTTAKTDHVLNAMAIDNPLEYARLYLNNEM